MPSSPYEGSRQRSLRCWNLKESYFDVQRYVFILFDEMKIMTNLALDKLTGELIEFTVLGDTYVNFVSLEKVYELATHALAFLVWGYAHSSSSAWLDKIKCHYQLPRQPGGILVCGFNPWAWLATILLVTCYNQLVMTHSSWPGLHGCHLHGCNELSKREMV